MTTRTHVCSVDRPSSLFRVTSRAEIASANAISALCLYPRGPPRSNSNHPRWVWKGRSYTGLEPLIIRFLQDCKTQEGSYHANSRRFQDSP